MRKLHHFPPLLDAMRVSPPNIGNVKVPVTGQLTHTPHFVPFSTGYCTVNVDLPPNFVPGS